MLPKNKICIIPYLHYAENPLKCFRALYHDVEDTESAHTPLCLS